MRHPKQRAQRLSRIKLANELLKLLKGREELEGYSPYEGIVVPFAEEREVAVFEVWKAWDILKEAGRREARPGSHWSMTSFEPIEANENGDIRSV